VRIIRPQSHPFPRIFFKSRLLNSGNVVVVSLKYKVLESSMDEIEEAIAIRNLKDNLEFLAA